MAPEIKPSHPVTKDQESYSPKFEFTRSLTDHFRSAGFFPLDYEKFLKPFDEYLEEVANTDKVLAIGILTVPGTQGLADGITGRDGIVICAITYWDLPKDNCDTISPSVDKDVLELDTKFTAISPASPFAGQRPKVASFVFAALSREEYPDLKSFRDAVNDKENAENLILISESCEYWGMVPTEDLRIQLMQNAVPGI